ncbi:hypothetical protein DL765_006947 [Monosporascus sp. GIB2]|nr:hypothetical protein DL765_006947 [Monosporascus sp. GIB2]
MCWFCPETFKVSKSANKDERRINFWNRVQHIQKHIKGGRKGVDDIRVDFDYAEHLHSAGLITDEVYYLAGKARDNSATESANQGEDSLLGIEALGNTIETCTLNNQSVSPDADSSPTESELTESEPTESASNDKDDEDDRGGDGRGNAGRNRKVPRLDEPAQQKIACPFMKRHPVEFSTWRTCLGPGFSDINRMKEHLKRRHYREHGCGRCGEHFKTNLLLQQHMRAVKPCPLREIETAMGFITQLQWNEISMKKRGAILDRWKEIYIILFPEVEESQIPGPFHDVSETADQLSRMINCDEFEAHMRADLPRRVLAQLNREFQIMAEHARQRVAEIAQEQSVATLAAFLQEKGFNAAGDEGVDLGILDDSFPFNFGLINQSDIFTMDVDASWLEVPN